MTDPTHKPLTADEIEALLRAAREAQPSVRSDVVSDEPLGPGDVQHLRNTSFSEASFSETLAQSGWPGNGLPADELLRQAEQQLAEAMSTQSDFPDSERPSVKSVAFEPSDVTEAIASSSGLPLDVIGDIELDVALELGRAEITIEELLQLREGSVLELDKAAGDPIDIIANGKLIARGEVIVVDGQFGVRICEVIAPRS